MTKTGVAQRPTEHLMWGAPGKGPNMFCFTPRVRRDKFTSVEHQVAATVAALCTYVEVGLDQAERITLPK